MREKTVENFIKGLMVLSGYNEDGLKSTSFCQAEHDQIYCFLDGDSELSNDDAEQMESYGFFLNEHGGWSYYT